MMVAPQPGKHADGEGALPVQVPGLGWDPDKPIQQTNGLAATNTF